jgi:hypothetical protein
VFVACAGGGAAHLCYPSIAKTCEVSAVHFAAFRRVPCSTSARHAWHTCPWEKAGKAANSHRAVWARVLWPYQARRRSCFAASRPTRRLASYDLRSYLCCGCVIRLVFLRLRPTSRQKAYQGLWGSQACCGPCAYLGLLGCVDLATSLGFANA